MDTVDLYMDMSAWMDGSMGASIMACDCTCVSWVLHLGHVCVVYGSGVWCDSHVCHAILSVHPVNSSWS